MQIAMNSMPMGEFMQNMYDDISIDLPPSPPGFPPLAKAYIPPWGEMERNRAVSHSNAYN